MSKAESIVMHVPISREEWADIRALATAVNLSAGSFVAGVLRDHLESREAQVQERRNRLGIGDGR